MSQHDATNSSTPAIDPRFRRHDAHGRPITPFVEQEGNTTRLFFDPLTDSPEEHQQAFQQSMELFFAILQREWNKLPYCSLQGPRTLANLRVPEGHTIQILHTSPPNAAGEVIYTFRIVKQENGDG